MADDPRLNVVVAYVSSSYEELIPVNLAPNATLEQAIQKSEILQKCSEIDLANSSLGINGKIVDRRQPLKDQDRVEIYRKLKVDPMLARRKRAESQG